jgi:hypothetical protein
VVGAGLGATELRVTGAARSATGLLDGAGTGGAGTWGTGTEGAGPGRWPVGGVDDNGAVIGNVSTGLAPGPVEGSGLGTADARPPGSLLTNRLI